MWFCCLLRFLLFVFVFMFFLIFVNVECLILSFRRECFDIHKMALTIVKSKKYLQDNFTGTSYPYKKTTVPNVGSLLEGFNTMGDWLVTAVV